MDTRHCPERDGGLNVDRATTLFSIEQSTLTQMDAKASVETFRHLLWCEVRRLGLSVTNVNISCREIADGGIDATVNNVPDNSGSFLREGSNRFQVKSGTSAKPWQPSWIRRELFGEGISEEKMAAARLGKAVLRCLRDGGRYILVCFGIDPTPEQIEQSQECLRECFRVCGFPDAPVEVWGQQHLLGLALSFPIPVIVTFWTE